MYNVKLSSKHSAFTLIAVEVFILGFSLLTSIALELFAPSLDEATTYFIQIGATQLSIALAAIAAITLSRRETDFSISDLSPAPIHLRDMLSLAVSACGLMLFTLPLASLFSMLLESLGVAMPTSPVTFGNSSEFLLGLVFVCVLPALCEEFAVRGLMLNGLVRLGAMPAMLLTGFIFAIMHGNPYQLIHQFFLGAVVAYVVLVSRNILSAMIMHFTNNFIALVLSALTSQAVSEPLPEGATSTLGPLEIIMTIVIFGFMMVVGAMLFSSKIKAWTRSTILSHVERHPEKRHTYTRWCDARGILPYVARLCEWTTDTRGQRERPSFILFIAILFALLILGLNTWTMVALL